MGIDRQIKSDGNVIIKGLTYPSSDGSNGQALSTNGSGSLSFTDVSVSGVRVVTLSNQTEANSYSTQENDFVKITGDVTLSDKTLVNVTFMLNSQTRTLTIDEGSAKGCKFFNGVLILKANSSHDGADPQTSGFGSIIIHRCIIRCHQVDILQALANSNGIVRTVVRDTFIKCSKFRYYYTNTTLETSENGNVEDTPSSFDNVQIIADAEPLGLPLNSEGEMASGNHAVADYTDVLATNEVVLRTQRYLSISSPGTGDEEHGSKTNCKKITLSNA
tara:strand:- start:3087 stop:3911 length:825 start_codon:yes stop_codon:yes gene_type:complete